MLSAKRRPGCVVTPRPGGRIGAVAGEDARHLDGFPQGPDQIGNLGGRSPLGGHCGSWWARPGLIEGRQATGKGWYGDKGAVAVVMMLVMALVVVVMMMMERVPDGRGGSRKVQQESKQRLTKRRPQ